MECTRSIHPHYHHRQCWSRPQPTHQHQHHQLHTTAKRLPLQKGHQCQNTLCGHPTPRVRFVCALKTTWPQVGRLFLCGVAIVVLLVEHELGYQDGDCAEQDAQDRSRHWSGWVDYKYVPLRSPPFARPSSSAIINQESLFGIETEMLTLE